MPVGGVAALITFGGDAQTIESGAGVAALITLGGGAPTVGAGVWVCTPTLGDGARVGDSRVAALITLGGGAPTVGAGAWVGDSRMFGGPPVGRLKMARRLSTASSWAWQLPGVRSARTAMVSALRQWMILSVVLNVGTARVGC